jgi:hypothetical protein
MGSNGATNPRRRGPRSGEARWRRWFSCWLGNLHRIIKKNEHTYCCQYQRRYFNPEAYILSACILICLLFMVRFSCCIAIRVFQGMPVSEVYRYLSVNVPENDETYKKEQRNQKRTTDSNAVVGNCVLQNSNDRKAADYDAIDRDKRSPK